MSRGTCALCRLEKDLVKSHFLPAGSYKPLHAERLIVNEPMVITRKRVIQTSRHITAHAFCADCEDVFDKGGEAWVLDKLATLTAFPLRDMVLAAPPVVDDPNIKGVYCDSILVFQTEQLVHLAMGIFWKATARSWNVIDGPLPQLELGPYKEPIRQFVLGAIPFPQNIQLIAFLDSGTPPFVATTSPRRYRESECHMFGLYLNGLQYWLFVGKNARAQVGDSCLATAPGHPIFVVPDAGQFMSAGFGDAAKGRRISTGVMRTFELWKALENKE